MISELDTHPVSSNNWKEFQSFYKERNLPVKIQNSGVFLLLLGYYLAVTYQLPLEIYGLDLGVGGETHFDGKGVIGKSVTNERVKYNVRMYLESMQNEHAAFVNYSNFKVT
jgi:hypothetical protein